MITPHASSRQFGSAQQLRQPGSHLPLSAVKSTLRQSFEQLSKSEGTKLPALGIASQPSGSGLSFSVPRPAREPFLSTVFAPVPGTLDAAAGNQAAVQSIPEIAAASVQKPTDSATEQSRKQTTPASMSGLEAAGLLGAEDQIPAPMESRGPWSAGTEALPAPAADQPAPVGSAHKQLPSQQSPGSAQGEGSGAGAIVADLRREATLAAAKDALEAEVFAAQALQSPQTKLDSLVSMHAATHMYTACMNLLNTCIAVLSCCCHEVVMLC